MSRTALLAGLALGEVDSRLPSMLAALLAEDTPRRRCAECWPRS
ncbi:plasmid stability family protein [Klebsiella aerogenes]|nr:plasmid stability family protein [Klebsiella aerogenes]